MSTTTVQTTDSVIDFHRGNVLMAIARTYPSLPLTLIEMMQNGIDADATRIFVVVDMINRTVVVADNGMGTDRASFDTALGQVGMSQKDTSKLGRFGRGLVSPLGKCKTFTFTSRQRGTNNVLMWTFKGDEIANQHHELRIPCDESQVRMPRLPKTYSKFYGEEFSQDWNTVIQLHGLVKDVATTVVDLDELESDVRTKLGRRMHELGVRIRVVLIDKTTSSHRDIDPVVYTGEKLEVVTMHDSAAGDVQFELYRSVKLAGKRNGQVSAMEMDGNYMISMQELMRQARARRLLDSNVTAAFEALTSGYFEGVIKCKNIVLAPERTKFEYNDALIGFFVVISDWFATYGQELMETEQEVVRERRYQDLGLRSQERLKALLTDPANARIRAALLETVQVGRLGLGHVDPTSGQPSELEGDSSLRIGQGGAGVSKTDRGGSTSRPNRKRGPDRPGDLPLGTTGPGGRRRRLVAGDSQGLWFEHSPLFANSHLWEFDIVRGVLTFNIKHPIWERLDETKGKHLAKNAKWIMLLQEWLSFEVLLLLLHYPDPEEFEEHRRLIDDKIRPYVDMFITS